MPICLGILFPAYVSLSHYGPMEIAIYETPLKKSVYSQLD